MIFLQQHLTYSPTIYYYYRLSGEAVTVANVGIALWALMNYSKFAMPYKWLLINLCISSLFEILGVVLVKLGFTNINFINYFYQIQESFTYGMFYYLIIQSRAVKNGLKYLFGIFLVLLWSSASQYKGLWLLPDMTAIFESFVFLALSILFFRQESLKPQKQLFKRQPLYWFNLYILFSFASSVLFYSVINSAIKFSDDIAMLIYMIRNSISLLCYAFLIIGIQCLRTFTLLK